MADVLAPLGGYNSQLTVRYRDKLDTTYALVVEAYPPRKLMTDRDGASSRLRVDPGSTGFFAGREFRTFYEFSLAGGATISFKVTLPIDIILEGLGFEIDDGQCKLEAYVLPATQAAFPTPLPKFGANNMSERPQPYYVSVITFATGGTFTGGTKTDVLSIKTNNNSNQSSTQDAAVAGERGLAAGDYFLRLTNVGAGVSNGIVRARWEERVP